MDSAEAMRSGLPYGASHGCGSDRNAQVRHRKAGEPRLGLGPDAGGALVANLAAGARRGARKRRDRGRMIVRLDLHQDMRRFAMRGVVAVRIRIEARHRCSLDHRRVVGIRNERPLRRRRMRVADHREQASLLRDAVDHPVRVEDLVPAVLGVRLREHHQLDVGRIAAEAAEVIREVVDFVRREGESQFDIRRRDRAGALGQERDRRQRARREMREQRMCRRQVIEHGLRHAVVQERQQCRAIGGGERRIVARGDAKADAALDPHDRGQPAIPGDVGRLRRPRRDRSGTGDH